MTARSQALIPDGCGRYVQELWEPGYYHPSARFVEMMRALEDLEVGHLQPTSGTTRFIGKVKVTVMGPGIGLRSRLDSYGVEVNDAWDCPRLGWDCPRFG